VTVVPVAVAAVASLFGPDSVQLVTRSIWFIIGAAALGALSLAAGIIALVRRRLPSALLHLGIVLALVGVGVDARFSRSGYLYLEVGAPSSSLFLSRDFRFIEQLRFELRLDSTATHQSRGFRPAPVAVLELGRTRPTVTYNQPAVSNGRRLLLTQTVEPGFLLEYGLTAGADEYVLLHNQQAAITPGTTIWSFAFDAAEQRVGLLAGSRQVWLGIGDTATVAGTPLQLTSASFAANSGAIFAVNDVRYRPVIFAGLLLSLFGLAATLLRRESP
jgi:hypothetical protein